MPQALHTVELPISNDVSWDFLKSYDNWATLIPGYIAHEAQSDSQFTWIFLADLGFTKKTIKLQVDITELAKPNEIKFQLKGLSDNFNGHGYFKTDAAKLSGSLDLSASGMMGMMINSVLEGFIPKTTTNLVEAIAVKLQELQAIK
ncbi:MAG: SRPBCC domain-containing protein [Solibacillus sp.]|jgi:carbon monoxide dehydrogenase subunit G|uniref:CoxG family protein n=1 Tax=unclassified Solibacillus TaxID=2637870 RepID=UPI0030F9A4C4